MTHRTARRDRDFQYVGAGGTGESGDSDFGLFTHQIGCQIFFLQTTERPVDFFSVILRNHVSVIILNVIEQYIRLRLHQRAWISWTKHVPLRLNPL